jgi:hypothetical protein
VVQNIYDPLNHKIHQLLHVNTITHVFFIFMFIVNHKVVCENQFLQYIDVEVTCKIVLLKELGSSCTH